MTNLCIAKGVRCDNIGCYRKDIDRILGGLGKHYVFCSKQCEKSFWLIYQKYQEIYYRIANEARYSFRNINLDIFSFKNFCQQYIEQRNLPTPFDTQYGKGGAFRDREYIKNQNIGFYTIGFKRILDLEDLF